uniref:IP12357p n=1 Tax=Drosophila melanogaster TaxID=7227 RepID=A8E6P9_DROME|nr:IP12357p [Drosophila melanogaster]
MDKENRSGDHLKYQPLGDQDGLSSKLPDILRAPQLTNAKESSATRGLGQSASKSEMGKSQLQNDSSLQKNIQETKTITGSCIEAQRIGATPKKQLEGVKEPNMISLLHTNASSNVDDRQRQETIDNEKSDVQKEKEDAKVKVIRNIEKVQFGRYEIETTSSSPL